MFLHFYAKCPPLSKHSNRTVRMNFFIQEQEMYMVMFLCARKEPFFSLSILVIVHMFIFTSGMQKKE